jgi:tetratricopeptide (TPR) repeat protein
MRYLLIMILFFPAATSAFAVDDSLSKAMKLYEKRHYSEAAAVLQNDPAAGKGAAHLMLGMIYLKNAELHRALYQESLALHLDYLQKLAATRGRARSRFVHLYLGEALLESGKPDAALNHLEKFAADEKLDPAGRTRAKAVIGLCRALRKNSAGAEEAWAGLDKADPESMAALAEAWSRAGLMDRKPVQLAEESLSAIRKTGKSPSIRHLKSLLSVYKAAGQYDKGVETARRADLNAYSFRESLGKTKSINFYDVSLLGDLAQIYLQAAVAALERAAGDAKLKETAGFYLGEAYSLAGNVARSIKTTSQFLASSGMPAQYRDKAMVRQAANQYQTGHQLEAIEVWDDLFKKQPEDPGVLAEILLVCGRLKIDCPKVAQRSVAAVETGEGKRYAAVNDALGRYFLAKKDYVKATLHLEAGRDKGNKNKIESNEPLMLVSLAGAYYRTKKFSEALEIYFEMSKHFPEVRQIQEALQGIYAMEHKSAGDVKIN